VLNSDQITNLNFARMLDFHRVEGAAITIASFTYEVAVPYGVLTTEGTSLVGVAEKPTATFPCSAGFYVVDPSVIARIPAGEPMTMPELIEDVMSSGGRVAVFPILETWIDIGTPEDLQRALLAFATGEEV
jgi:NDP-sugar pyrophosphorylase family protein